MIGAITPSRLLASALCLVGVALSALVSFVKGDGPSGFVCFVLAIGPQSSTDLLAYFANPFFRVCEISWRHST